MSVQLIIKSAAQNVEDFLLTCEMSWTIAQVKDQITALYPTKPASEHQKLIYGGKLLLNHLPLTSILNPSQDVHTLHLVCPFPLKNELPKSNSNKAKNISPACTVPPLTPGAIYPQVNQQLPTPPVLANASTIGTGTFALNTPADAVHQYLAMQQMYTQFMAQYFSQYNNGIYPNGQVPVTTPPVQQAAPPPPQQNINQNVEARPQERWDFIDLLYIASRASILFAILVYYSSPSRVIAVCVLALLLALFAKINKERQQQRAANERLSENIITQQIDEHPETDNAEETNEETPIEEQPVTTAPASTVQSMLISMPFTIYIFITSFFTSLVPSAPPPVNVN